jgi:hypothetical protein
MNELHVLRPYQSKTTGMWNKYLLAYFGENKDLSLLDEFRLSSSIYKHDVVVQVQDGRVPTLFTFPKPKHFPSDTTDFVCNYINTSMDIDVLFFDDDVPSATLQTVIDDSKTVRTIQTRNGYTRPLILNSKRRSIVEGLTIIPGGLCESTLDKINRFNLLWNTRIGKVHCGISGVLSEPSARSISHFHHLPFWNFSYRGTKLYILYDIRVAQKRGFVSVEYNTSTSSTPLRFEHFLELATLKCAWLAEMKGCQLLLVPEHIAHDVFTVDDGMLYMGMQGNWLADSKQARSILLQSTYKTHDEMQFPATKRDVERILDETLEYSQSSNDDDSPEFHQIHTKI